MDHQHLDKVGGLHSGSGPPCLTLFFSNMLPFVTVFSAEDKSPFCFQNVPKSWTTQNAYLLSMHILTLLSGAIRQALVSTVNSAIGTDCAAAKRPCFRDKVNLLQDIFLVQSDDMAHQPTRLSLLFAKISDKSIHS